MLKTTERAQAIFALALALAFSFILFHDPAIGTILILTFFIVIGELAWLLAVKKRPLRWFSLKIMKTHEDDSTSTVISKMMYPGDTLKTNFLLNFKGATNPKIVSVKSDNEFLILEIRPHASDKRSLELLTSFRTPFSGKYKVNFLAVELSDPLGLFRIECRIKISMNFTVYPRVVDIAIRSAKILSKGGIGETPIDRPGIGTEFFDLRSYQFGDDYRDINWKATARRGELVVLDRAKEVGASFILCLEESAQNYFDRDRLASTFLQLSNSLAILGIRFGVIVHREGRLLAQKPIGEPYPSLQFALNCALEFANVSDREIPEDIVHAVPSTILKANQRMLDRRNQTLLSEIEATGFTNNLRRAAESEQFKTLMRQIKDNYLDVPSVIYISGLPGSLVPLIEFATGIKREMGTEFIIVNPTSPWIVSSDEPRAMKSFERHRKNLRILSSAQIDWQVGDPLTIAQKVFSS